MRDRLNAVDELAKYLVQKERKPLKLVGSTTAGGNSLETRQRALPVPIGSPGDVLTVVTNGDGDLVPSWTRSYSRTVATSDDITAADRVVLSDATLGSIVLTLPPAGDATAVGALITVKKIDSSANTVTITPDGTETLDGGGGYALTVQWTAVTIVSDGSNWFVIAEVV